MNELENVVFLRESFDALEEWEKAVVKYRYLYGYTQEQIAEKLGISRSTVYRIQKRAYDKLGI